MGASEGRLWTNDKPLILGTRFPMGEHSELQVLLLDRQAPLLSSQLSMKQPLSKVLLLLLLLLLFMLLLLSLVLA